MGLPVSQCVGLPVSRCVVLPVSRCVVLPVSQCIARYSGPERTGGNSTQAKKVQTNAYLFNTDTQYAHFWGNPLDQATKRHLNNRYTFKKDEK